MMNEQHLYRVKSPEESKGAWDYYTLVKTVPGELAFTTKAESTCSLW